MALTDVYYDPKRYASFFSPSSVTWVLKTVPIAILPFEKKNTENDNTMDQKVEENTTLYHSNNDMGRHVFHSFFDCT